MTPGQRRKHYWGVLKPEINDWLGRSKAGLIIDDHARLRMKLK
jgi:hypothetical protein